MMKPKQKKRGLLLILAAAAMILSACGAAAEAEPTTDPNMVFTQVAETVMVSMTQTSQAMPPTATPEPTATLAPTQPPVPTVDLTQVTQEAAVPTVALGPTATVQIYGDGAQWKNQSPMDGKVFSEGEEFTFHVCWINIGSTDWDETFYLKFVDGNNLWSNTKTFYVGDIVEPGDTWCFDLPSVAPWSAGSYITRWYLYDGDGNFINEVYFSYKVE